ncbi:MAG: site-specific integrase [Actinomycetota bacterium]|nr:site-specific integrase [Actinomycetota bacterium]
MTELLPIEAEHLPEPMPQPPARAANPYWVYLDRFDGKESERTMGRCLDRVAVLIAPPLAPMAHPGEWIPWHQMRYGHMAGLRKRIIAGDWLPEGTTWSPSHVNKHLSALRGVLKESWRLGLMSAEDYHRAIDVESVSASRGLRGRNIHADEISALISKCTAEPGPLGIRDAAIIALLNSTGLRRDEVASALIERYDPSARALRVIGKGDKERPVFVHPAAVPVLDRWLVTAGARRGPVFRPVDRWGNIGSGPLNARTIGHIVARRQKEAAVPAMSTHDFRRTFIGDFIDAGGDLAQAQQLAGHASPATTARYDRRDELGRRAAVDRMSLPALEGLGNS